MQSKSQRKYYILLSKPQNKIQREKEMGTEYGNEKGNRMKMSM